MKRGRKQEPLRQWFEQAKPGQLLYTQIAQNNITAYAYAASRIIKTERCLIIPYMEDSPQVEKITKVTVIK